MRLDDFLLKYRSMVIALAVVTSVGVGLFMHLKPPVKKDPPRPTAPIQVRISQSRKPAVESRSNNRQPKLESVSKDQVPNWDRVSPRPQAIEAFDVRSEPVQTGTGQYVPIIVERRQSVVAIVRENQPQQTSRGETQVQAVNDELEGVEGSDAASDGAMPFFAPPVPPEGGINALIEGGAQTDVKEALAAYIRTYYPLVTLDAESISLLDSHGKAEYERQKAALDKELLGSLRDMIVPTPGEVSSDLSQELIDLLRSEDPIENQRR